MDVIRFFLIVMSLLAVSPVAVYCLEVIASCWSQRSKHADASESPRPRVAVIVPAHDEQAGIAATLRSIQSQLAPDDQLLVVADNCQDQTAAIAGRLNATVLERRDEYRRGKGFALAFGLEKLSADPPPVVLFFDADCRIGPGTVDLLAREAHVAQRPAQALYLCEPTADGGAQQRISALAFRFKNLIRTAGMTRLGGGCYLTGSGMALPWSLVDKVPWATGNVVEDMQLGIDFTVAGYPPRFVPAATVLSNLPASAAGLLAQRRRWEHGFLATALNEVPLLLTQAVEHRSWALLVLAVDLAVPPLALLSMALGVIWMAALLIWLIGLGGMPLAIATWAGFSFAGATLLGWAMHCRDVAPASLLLQVPRYLLSKIPLYLQFITRREQRWVRAERTH
jgi:cellulose synthase/poly-beta-1,6-N-acetylglucosamine synthase-like glycosyltransferase